MSVGDNFYSNREPKEPRMSKEDFAIVDEIADPFFDGETTKEEVRKQMENLPKHIQEELTNLVGL